MLIDVKVPVLAESVPDVTLLDWKKEVGDAVGRDEILIELETDKVVLELAAPRAGVLTEILRPGGDTARSEEVLARIDTEGAAVPPEPSGTDAEKAGSGRSSGVPPEPPGTEAEKAPPPATGEPRISPAARKLAEEQGVEPSRIAGTGRGGRITKADVLALRGDAALAAPPSGARAERDPEAAAPAMASPQVTPGGSAPAAVPLPAAEADRAANAEAPATPSPAVPARAPAAEAPASRGERREPMSRLRARIAERLRDAQQNAAILSTFNEVDMGPVMALRRRYRERFEEIHGARLGFMSFFVTAAARALRRFPAVNARIEGQEIVYHDYCDVGVAVASPRGLVVPILRNAEHLSFAEIESKIAEFGERARDGALRFEEMSGGTFTISNGGVFGSLLSTPILNPPQSAILGMHKIEERPVAERGEVVVRPMMYLALSYDHRLIDGREAVLFLVSIKEAIEDPARLLLEV